MAISGYNSPVDIGLGQSPQSTDPALFNELTDVYNAIHMINQYLDQLRVVASGGTGSDESPASSLPFSRFFTAVLLQNTVAGNLVSPSPLADGIVNGGLAHDYTSAAPESNASFIALNDGIIGDSIQVGVGPAILALAGFTSGQIAWGIPSLNTAGAYNNNGTIYNANPGGGMPVGVCIRDGFVLFGPFVKR